MEEIKNKFEDNLSNEITYDEWVKEYQPRKNQYFSNADFDGTLYSKEDIAGLSATMQNKQVWSLVRWKRGSTIRLYIRSGLIVSMDESMRVIGYFVTSKRYSNNIYVLVE